MSEWIDKYEAMNRGIPQRPIIAKWIKDIKEKIIIICPKCYAQIHPTGRHMACQECGAPLQIYALDEDEAIQLDHFRMDRFWDREMYEMKYGKESKDGTDLAEI